MEAKISLLFPFNPSHLDWKPSNDIALLRTGRNRGRFGGTYHSSLSDFYCCSLMTKLVSSYEDLKLLFDFATFIFPAKTQIQIHRFISTCPFTPLHVMSAATMVTINLFDDKLFTESLPATAALEEAQRHMTIAREGKRASYDSKIADSLFKMSFDDSNVESFPCIEWDNGDEDSDSDSERSMDSWSSLLSNSESLSLGKRGRGKFRRMVRSKKIKSDLASLCKTLVPRSA